jgi:hypothetical protein
VIQGMYHTPAQAPYTSPYAPVAMPGMPQAEFIHTPYHQPGTRAAVQEDQTLLKVNGYTLDWLRANFDEDNLTALLRMARTEFIDNDKWELHYKDSSGGYHRLRIIQCIKNGCDYLILRPHAKTKHRYADVVAESHSYDARTRNICGNHQ